MSMDLDQDYTINGHTFKKGKDVDVSAYDVDANGKSKKVDYSETIKAMQESGAKQREWETTHHGAVPAPADPQEATAQTPTRPLAAPNVRVDEQVVATPNTGEVVEVKDPSADGKGRSADESNKDVLENVKSEVVANEEAAAVNEEGNK